MKFFLFLLVPIFVYGSNILSYNIYDRSDRVDVMITFDTPYTGTIKQSSSSKNIIIKLEDAKIESAKAKKLSSHFLQAITITPMAGYTQIVASVPPSIDLQASKTSDAYGLRLRFTTRSASKEATSKQSSNPLSALPTKTETEIPQSYYLVIAFLMLAIIVLFVLKKKISAPTQKTQKQNVSWLFNTKQNQTTTDTAQKSLTQDVSIRFQKTIDSHSSVVMLDFGEQSYLVLMGGNNILLDKFTDNKPVTQSEFETILQNRHQQLDTFLQVDSKPKQEPLQSYKEKASSISYDV